MSELLQTGQHPDADQLNAFVEHSLSAHEQQQTLAHLAACPACRQVVALSLPPADDPSAERPQPVRSLFRPSHIAWATISALAALILVVVFLREHGFMERTTPAPSLITGPAPAQVAVVTPAAPSPAVSKPPVTVRHPAPTPRYSGAKGFVTRADRPEQGTPGGVMGGILGGIMVPPANQPAGSVAGGGSVFGFANRRALSPPRLMPGLLPGLLPSHLAVLSMASRAGLRLAIDTANQVFLSDDNGRNWKAVSLPWKGRAIRVALISTFSSPSQAPAAKLSSLPSPPRDPGLSGILAGTVTDPSGALIPGVTITATTGTDSASSRNVTTDSQGTFRMEDLALGRYQIKAHAAGFLDQSLTAQIDASQPATVNIILQVGSVSQTVTVEHPTVFLGNPATDRLQSIQSPPGRAPERFEITTDKGEVWVSSDGVNWVRK